MTKLMQILAGAASVTLMTTAAHAASITVKANDLDLASPAGQQELDRRATAAARTVCKGVYEAQTNCVPGAKSQIIAKATANGVVTIEKKGGAVSFAANSVPATTVAAN